MHEVLIASFVKQVNAWVEITQQMFWKLQLLLIPSIDKFILDETSFFSKVFEEKIVWFVGNTFNKFLNRNCYCKYEINGGPAVLRDLICDHPDYSFGDYKNGDDLHMSAYGSPKGENALENVGQTSSQNNLQMTKKRKVKFSL
jgi:hypothetical protein